MEDLHEQQPIRAAQRIIGELVTLRETLQATAEGFAVLDFAQGHVATELPTDTARDLVAVVRGADAQRQRVYLNDLVIFWLESYRRAYSRIIMRVLENDGDRLTA